MARAAPFAVMGRLQHADGHLDVVAETEGRGRVLAIERPSRAPAVCLIEIERGPGPREGG